MFLYVLLSGHVCMCGGNAVCKAHMQAHMWQTHATAFGCTSATAQDAGTVFRYACAYANDKTSS